MKLRKVPPERVCIGQALPFDVFDAHGRLLLRRGTVVESEPQAQRLLDSGLCEPEALARAQVDEVDNRVIHDQPRPMLGARRHVRAFRELGPLAGRYDELLGRRDPDAGFESEVLAVAAQLRACSQLDNDASLAHILLSGHLRYTVRHPINVALLATVLLGRLHVDEAAIRAAAAAALTMNLSMVALQETLYAQEAPATAAQQAEIRDHPRASVELLRRRGVGQADWLEIVAQHHEAIDGSGYPAGLKGDAIRIEAQVVSLADRYCAMVNEREHRTPMLPTQALRELNTKHGHAIPPKLIGTLIAAMGVYPPGSCVRLANGDVGLVVNRLLDVKHPVVFALHARGGTPYEPPRKRATGSQPQFEIAEVIQRTELRAPIDPDLLWQPSAYEAPGAG